MEIKEEIVIEAIANYMVVTGCACTMSSNYIFYASELAEKFGVSKDWIIEKSDEIVTASLGDAVLAVEDYEEDDDYVFDFVFGTAYCGLDDDSDSYEEEDYD